MSEPYNSISKGLEEAIEYSKGNAEGAREFKPKHIDVKRLKEHIVRRFLFLRK
jgi:hypothetical protein